MAVLTALLASPIDALDSGHCTAQCTTADTTSTSWSGLAYLLIVIFTVIIIKITDKVMCPQMRVAEGRVGGVATSSATAADAARNDERWQFVNEPEEIELPRPTRSTADVGTQTSHVTCRDASSQSQCTYTSVRGSNHPRFYVLPEHSHGYFGGLSSVC